MRALMQSTPRFCNNAGVFDVSHMGEFILKGENALDLIQRVTTNDASKISNGKANTVVLPITKAALLTILSFIASRKIKCTCWW